MSRRRGIPGNGDLSSVLVIAFHVDLLILVIGIQEKQGRFTLRAGDDLPALVAVGIIATRPGHPTEGQTPHSR